jgi:hypothetical protein
MGHMRTRTSWLALLLTATGLLAARSARAQDYGLPDPDFPLPLYSTRPDAGGMYAAAEFIFWRMSNPIKDQTVAFRGLVDFDGTITADLGGQLVEIGSNHVVLPGTPMPGTFLGSGTPALSTADVHGPQTYQPGFETTIGWRFRDGLAIEASWWHLFEAKYAATATLVPPNLQGGQLLLETFLFSPVFNFPNDFAGPPIKISLGAPLAAYGIWNGASIMNLQFTQRFDQFEITGRIPLYQGEDCRCYGLVGPTLDWIWERFWWRTVAQDVSGAATQDWVALYSNVVSNRLYGVHMGGGTEYRLGDTPVGTFAVSADLQAVPEIDVVKERAKYERADHVTAAQRARTEYKAAGELEGQFNLWWYPIEGVQVRIGYDAMGFFNTVSSPYPIDFNYGRLDPGWRDSTFRFIDGFSAGIGFIF